MRIGLASNRLHHDGRDAALPRLVREWEGALRERLRPTLLVVGGAHAALRREGLLAGYPGLVALPDERDGGLMRLVAHAVDEDPARGLDAVVHLIDPSDPASIYPEAHALKRQCVVHGRPFLSTLAGAREWLELANVRAGGTPSPAMDPVFDFAGDTIALVAHDARKARMVAFVEEHFDFFDGFARRIATGTTGGLLNEVARRRGVPDPQRWVERLESGPLGGDAQIAERLLDRQCRRVVFFEDPHVARQHEADIQLLERAARIVGEHAICVADERTTRAWVEGCARRAAARAGAPAVRA